MRYKFDSTFPELGYIKELLKEFNLPKYRAITDITKLYKNQFYIKDLGIYKYNGTNLIKQMDYYFNRPILNLTSNMNITTSSYGSDIHEYLGNYLRFIRDYIGLNLMPLYNCFSNRVIYPVGYDEGYNYYAIPVKFNEVYTIGFDSSIPVEIYCTLWDNVEIRSVLDKNVTIEDTLGSILKNDTKLICNNCKLNNPFIYDKLKEYDATTFLPQRDNLKLIIKLPSTNKTSITVLEGDYIFDTISDGRVTTTEYLGDETVSNKKYFKNYPTDLSLFSINDEEKHPFADRLMEYLLDTAITQVDALDDNIKRTQEYLRYLRGATPKILYGVWDENMNREIYNIATNSYLENNVKYIKNKYHSYIKTNSEGTTTYKSSNRNLIDESPDLLMYVDKDIEALFLSTNYNENNYTR